jgi:hypothetical protein
MLYLMRSRTSKRNWVGRPLQYGSPHDHSPRKELRLPNKLWISYLCRSSFLRVIVLHSERTWLGIVLTKPDRSFIVYLNFLACPKICSTSIIPSVGRPFMHCYFSRRPSISTQIMTAQVSWPRRATAHVTISKL